MKLSQTVLGIFLFAFSTLASAAPSYAAMPAPDRCPGVPHPVQTQAGERCNAVAPQAVQKSNARCTQAMRTCKKGSTYCWNRC